MTKVKRPVGLIGSGRWASVLCPKINKIFEVRSFTSGGNKFNIEKIKEICPNAIYYSDLNKILNDSRIQAVFILTPIKTHGGLVKKSLDAGKNVFVEKPLTGNYQDSKKLLKMAEKNEKVLFVGYSYLYSDIFMELDKSIDPELRTILKFHWDKWGTFKESIHLNLLSHELSILVGLGFDLSSGVIKKMETMENGNAMKLVMTGKPNFKATFEIDRVSEVKNKKVSLSQEGKDYIWEDESLYLREGGKKDLFVKKSVQDTLINELSHFNSLLDEKSGFSSNDNIALEIDRFLSREDFIRN